jgi:hypothetical protein
VDFCKIILNGEQDRKTLSLFSGELAALPFEDRFIPFAGAGVSLVLPGWMRIHPARFSHFKDPIHFPQLFRR